ncbi:RNA polymerase sigma-70 factor (sigma-E family) [Kibdelosporangium banguiense]|uniref:RNA polymerase sigma-70 factor (Sigma-E family) n=1 Tax=Kibdelosporangium banguiense TaxID=1365924 RepID=A0ABS4TH68_9PSEU|nr:SigE family RNA polymerase sigma factor [Kibdelosporangium banguiense]MBP2323691.1 RNA polymerase sigma-70 factor (sigma-E family) [Kibdelosporangium banguiense]
MTFDEFMTARLPALLRYAAVLTGDVHLAEDIVQEVLVRTHRKWRRIGTLDLPERYVRRMITNEFLSWRRRKSSQDMPVAPADMAEFGFEATDMAGRYAERDALSAQIDRLPRAQQAVLVLRYICDLPDAEIASLMGCRPSSVRSYASRALATLRTVVPLEGKGSR